MATAIYSGGRVRTNIPAENAYNALTSAGKGIANSQLRLSTGKRINAASDDVAGYITSKALLARNGALKAAHTAAGDAKNVTAMAQDSLTQIADLLTQIKDNVASASSGALGSDEKVALAKASTRLAEQIQFVVDSTVFGGQQLLDGNFTGNWVTGYTADNKLMTIDIDLRSSTEVSGVNNVNGNLFGIVSGKGMNLNATANVAATNAATGTIGSSITGNTTDVGDFAAVTGLDLKDFADIDLDDMGILENNANSATSGVHLTLQSLTTAINNVNKMASYLGGVQVRLNSQEDILTSQITNYKAAISRIEDADVAEEQMNLIRNQFLQSASLTSLAQANQNPSEFLQLLR